jgi:peptidoglycan hydrolase-like protein with peptidoglycan-binding domain
MANSIASWWSWFTGSAESTPQPKARPPKPELTTPPVGAADAHPFDSDARPLNGAAVPATPQIRPVAAFEDGILCRGIGGDTTPTGLLVQVLQAALKQSNFYTQKIDGEFGPATEGAVKKFQETRGGTADGRCRALDWQDITGLDPPSLFDRCVHLTAAFEGTGFQGAVGNFDGAYLTFGLIGLTLKSDLPAFLIKVEKEYPGSLERAFGANEGPLRRIITASPSDQEAWANSISTGANRYGLRTDWKEGFARLGSFPEVQKLQLENARDRYWAICAQDAKRWLAADALDVAIFYDTAVQMGGIGGRPLAAMKMDALVQDEPGLKGKERRLRWAEIIADAANPRWRQDVLSRRRTIAEGIGKVHGAVYRMVDWGLGADEIDLYDPSCAHITFMPASFQTVPGADGPVAAAAAPPSDLPSEPVAEPPTAPQASHAEDHMVAPPSVAATISTANLDLARDYRLVVAVALASIAKQGLDRNWGNPPPIPLMMIMEKCANKITDDWRSWPAQRQAVAVVQVICKQRGADPGMVDGYWGHVTNDAYQDLCYFRDHGRLPELRIEPNNATVPSGANPRNWPKESHAALTAYYGPHGLSAALVSVRCPWPLQLAWEPYTPVKTISCHRKVADSLGAVLEAVHQHYGEPELKRLGLDLFGGCYNNRKMRESDRWSTHAWGIALDWDPDRNALKWHKDKASLARPEYNDWWAAWEREGWYSLGRKKDYDWMHVQAAWR